MKREVNKKKKKISLSIVALNSRRQSKKPQKKCKKTQWKKFVTLNLISQRSRFASTSRLSSLFVHLRKVFFCHVRTYIFHTSSSVIFHQSGRNLFIFWHNNWLLYFNLYFTESFLFVVFAVLSLKYNFFLSLTFSLSVCIYII